MLRNIILLRNIKRLSLSLHLFQAANLALTNAIIKFGWQPPEPRSAHDILPVVIELPGQEPKMYHWQPDEVLEVLIEHPTVPEFKEIGMRWYAIPAISNFSVHIGGIHYGCMPFNGWYMDTEILRDFLDEYRYNKMEEIAQVLKLDIMVIAKTIGQLSHIEAAAFFEQMKQEKRFHTDVWGVQLNFKQAIQQVQKDNYSKAEKWLERVKQSTNESVAEEAQAIGVQSVGV